jgi:hypothetical protein
MLAAQFAGLADAEPDGVARQAEQVFETPDWIGPLFAPLLAALAADPWFEPPLRVARERARSGAILYEDKAVTIGLSLLSASAVRAAPLPATIVASGRLTVTRYLRAGGATLLRWGVPPVGAECTAAAMSRARPLPPLALTDGAVVRHDGRSGAQLTIAPTGDILSLTATVRTRAAPMAREYDRASGDFIRMATNDEGAARAQLLLSLLRASAAAGADDAFDAATRDGAFFLRWSAMREWLAYDWRAACGRLRDMAADDPHPEVRGAARATLAALTRRAA